LKVLILEDNAERVKQFNKNIAPCHTVIVTDDALQCIEFLKSDMFDVLFLDHDLGGEIYVDINEENTGSTVARWLSENPSRIPESVYLHSLNEYGRKNMQYYIPNSIQLPFAWTVLKIL